MSRPAAKILGAKLQNSAETGLHKTCVYHWKTLTVQIAMNGFQGSCNSSMYGSNTEQRNPRKKKEKYILTNAKSSNCSKLNYEICLLFLDFLLHSLQAMQIN